MNSNDSLSPAARKLKEELLGEFHLTVDDVAGILEVDRSTIYRYIQDGRLVALKLGREYRLAESDVRQFIASLLAEMRAKAAPGAKPVPAHKRSPKLTRYGPAAVEALQAAERVARSMEERAVGPVHVLRAVVEQLCTSTGCLTGITLPPLPDTGPRRRWPRWLPGRGQLPFTPDAKRLLTEAAPALAKGQGSITVVHVLLALLEDEATDTDQPLIAWGIDPAALRRQLSQ